MPGLADEYMCPMPDDVSERAENLYENSRWVGFGERNDCPGDVPRETVVGGTGKRRDPAGDVSTGQSIRWRG